MKVSVVFHSLYGHTWRMAEAAAEGVRETAGAEARVYRVPETLSPDVLKMMGAVDAQKAFAHVPVAEFANLDEVLVAADAVIFGTPTRFGMMSAQMRAYLDMTGQLWMKGALIGKIGSVFASTATQHGGQESTILSFHTTLLHQGMIIVGLPYSEKRQMTMDEISGGTPYGATTLTGGDGKRLPSANELAMARFQGRHVAETAARMRK